MKRQVGLLVVLAVGFAISAIAQDSVLLKPKWQDYFAKTVNDRYAFLTLQEFDRFFQHGRYYDGLLVFKDSTKTSIEVKIKYKGIADLCNKATDLEYGMLNKWGEMAYNYVPQSKRELKMFVFADITFIWRVLRTDRKFGVTPDRWSIVILNGPFFATRTFYNTTTASGKFLSHQMDFIQKYNESTMRQDLKVFDYFSFKKSMGKAVAENLELVNKIMNEEEGYKREDTMKILIEYNEWVKQTDPEKYRLTLDYPRSK